MKNKILIIFLLFVFLCIPPIVFAHGGRTDSNGGHIDSSTGEYHYHHGYSAHQHPNGICPYDTYTTYDQLIETTNTENWYDNISENCPNCGASFNKDNGTNCFDCGYEFSSALVLTDGDSTKTRSEYFFEVQELNNKIDSYKNEIDNLKQENNNLTNEINTLKNESKNSIDLVAFLFAVPFVGMVAYQIGYWKDKK